MSAKDNNINDLSIESGYWGSIIAGIDEAGRGPLAGPVVAGAVILPSECGIVGIKDSKKLSAKKREELYAQITNLCCWGVGIVPPEEIDEINILEATKKACVLAVASLARIPEVCLVDGNMKFTDPRFVSIIKGDSLSRSIAAASIIAKVTRDRIMHDLSAKYPEYLWHKNSGYGTKDHISAILKHGLSPHHRQSFKLNSLSI